jgi:UDP-N-acetylmuramoylalanine--D-glutamate ligase
MSAAVQTLEGKHVLVLGLARQGTALSQFLVQVGALVTVSDLRTQDSLSDALDALAGLPLRYVLGGHPVTSLEDVDIVCPSGGVPLDIPIVAEAKRRGIPLSNDAEIFMQRCPARVIGITGSAGKTTTTALVGAMCRCAGMRTWVGGNIGNPLISELSEIEPGDAVILELSSFQLELVRTGPAVAAVLNVTPNHLDRHRTMESYVAAKQNILAHQDCRSVAVLGRDDSNTRAMAPYTAGQVLWFSGQEEVSAGSFCDGDKLVLRIGGADQTICNVRDIRLRGSHNWLNVLAASVLASVAGVPLDCVAQVATSFSGVAHRLELVRVENGVEWYDDSIATAPERTMAALRSFDGPIVLLAGGRDKRLPWDQFAALVVRRVRHLVTFGEAGPMIEQKVRESWAMEVEGSLTSVTGVGTLGEAVTRAAELARGGDVVLLSPGATSFDAFRDFEERGRRFKELVAAL